MQTESFLRFYTSYAEDNQEQVESAQIEAESDASATVFRVDKFVVPTDALSVFLEKMRSIQRTLRTLPGCRRAMTLNQTGNTGAFNVVTYVEWANAEAVSAAGAAMQRVFESQGFNPASFAQGLGVKADLGFYTAA